ncbi:MAG TPA: hypothetical protein VM681_02720 [Candidatus Thermoplasmatota archaeon]|nr:hypothetical protein [Candidatus Thermoplasmatota archaeon]
MARALPSPDFFKPAFLRSFELDREVAHAVEKPVVHLSHGDCLDGATSDALVRLRHGNARVGTLFCDPGDVLDRLRRVAAAAVFRKDARLLLVSDLSLQLGQADAIASALSDLRARGWRVEWRDHHHKQWEGGALATVRAAADHVSLDAEGKECGASLVARELLPGDDFATELAAIVRDVDLWIRKDPRSATLTHARHRWGSARFVQKVVGDKAFLDEDVRAAARAWEQEFEREMWRAVKDVRIEQGRNKVGVIYGDYPGSDVCDRVRKEKATDVEINLKPSGKFSIRSRPDLPVAASVAQKFDGGGHPNAAGGHLRIAGPVGWTVYWATQGKDSVAARRLVDAAKDAVP